MVVRCRVFDSFTGVEFWQHKIWAIAYEPVWQLLRVKCKFSTPDQIRASAARLDAYIGLAKGETELQLRLFRVFNLLNAIPIGQISWNTGITRVSREEENQILPYRERIKTRVLEVGKPPEWDWHTTRLSLMDVWRTDEDGLYYVYNILATTRAARTSVKPELRYFLKLVEETAPP